MTTVQPASRTQGGVAALFAAAVIAAGAAYVKPWESGGKVHTVPYRDIVGVLTVCDGITGKGVIEGKTYTKAECEALLQERVAEAYSHVQRCIKNPNLNQAVALTSATFNIGPRVVCGSTLQKYANAGDWNRACAELLRWNKAGGREVNGLTLRRIDENAVCLTPPQGG